MGKRQYIITADLGSAAVGQKRAPFWSLGAIEKNAESGPVDQPDQRTGVERSLTEIVYGHCVSELGPTLEDLHAEIGRTLVVWGWLEAEMIDAGINWRHASLDASPQPLKLFLHNLAEPRGVRNAIAHGLASAHSDPWTPEVEPYVTCRTLDAGVRKITLGDLRRTQSQLQRLRNILRNFAQPTSANSR